MSAPVKDWALDPDPSYLRAWNGPKGAIAVRGAAGSLQAKAHAQIVKAPK